MSGKLYTTFVDDEGPLNAPLWFVGESPGQTEEAFGKPLIGDAGQILMEVLQNHGINRSDVRLANLCKYRPYGNDFRNCIGTAQLQESFGLLRKQIDQYKPHVIVALGGYALSYLTNHNGIESYRGSIVRYKYDSSIKVISSRHPAAVARDRKLYPIFDFDIGRAIGDSKFREFNYPQYEFIIDPKGYEREEWVTKLENWPNFLSCDIENIKGSFQIICIGFGISPTQAVVFPWNDETTPFIYRILRSSVPKCFHYGTHDTTVLEENGFETNRYEFDTMALQHVLNPEMPRGLAFLCSIHTRQPYYKAEGRATLPNEGKGWSAKTDLQKLYAYNATDCCVTWDAGSQLIGELYKTRRSQIKIFEYEMEMIQCARAMSRAGMLIDNQRRNILRNSAVQRWRKRQGMFNFLAHYYNPKWLKDCNVNSPKMVKELLYDDLKLPVKRNRDGSITADEDAIVELLSYVKTEGSKVSRPDAVKRWQEKEAILSEIINIRGLRKLISSYLTPKISNDGRLRSTFKVSSTETARWACEKFVDKTGINTQTFPRDPIFVEEEDMKVYEAIPLTDSEIKDILEPEPEEENEIVD